MISVIIPCYNSEKTIVRAVSSLEQTSFTDYEIIVVNDGSNDKSRDLIEKYILEHPNVRIINQTNAGVTNAIATGIESANGEYVTFLDSDDYVDKNYLQVISCEIENYDILALGHKVVDPYGKILHVIKKDAKRFNNKTEVRDLLNKLYFDNHSFDGFKYVSVYKWAVVVKSQIAKSIVAQYVEENFSLYEDMCFILLTVANANSLKISDYCGVNYVQQKATHSRSHESSYDDLIQLRLKINNFIDKYCNRYSIAKNIFSTIDFDVSKFYFSRYIASHTKEESKQFFEKLKHDSIYQSQKHLVDASRSSYIRKLYYFFLKHNMFLPIYLFFKR